MSEADTNNFDVRDAHYEMRKVSELQNWDENPRSISDSEYERLQEHIRRLGVYKPLLINQNNIVLGGNMRLRALKDLGVDEVMCSVVLTDNKAQMIEYALSDNDQMGTTDQQKLAELATINPIKLEIFAIQIGKITPVQTVVDNFSPTNDDNQGRLDQTKTLICPQCGHEGKVSEFQT